MRLAEFSRWENILRREPTGGVLLSARLLPPLTRSPSLTEGGRKSNAPSAAGGRRRQCSVYGFYMIRLPLPGGVHHYNAQKSGRPMVARCGCIFRLPFTGAPYFAALASAALQTGQSPCRSSVYDVIWQPVRDSIISVRSPHQMSTTLPHPSQNRCSWARTQPS